MEYKYDYEIIGKKGNRSTERDRSVSSSCGQLFKSLKLRDRCHKEGEAKMDVGSEALLGSSQRDQAKWQRYHGIVAVF